MLTNHAERVLLEEIRAIVDVLVDEELQRNMREAADQLEDAFLDAFLDNSLLQEDLPDENF